MIYVLDTDGCPLAPTHRHKHIHMLIKTKQAKVVFLSSLYNSIII